VSVCLSVRGHISRITCPIFTKCFVCFTYGGGMVLLSYTSLSYKVCRLPETEPSMHHCFVTYIHTHTHLTAVCLGLPGWAGSRKVKPIWILLKQEIVSGSGISRSICKSAPRSRQTTTPAPHHSVFYCPDALPAAQPTASFRSWGPAFIWPSWCHCHQMVSLLCWLVQIILE